MTRAARRPVLAAATVLALAGCAGADAAAAPSRAPAERPVVQGATGALPAPCTVVDAADLSLFVAFTEWAQAGSDVGGRSTCRFDGRGVVVTTVAVAAGQGPAPAALCAPQGSSPLPGQGPALCRYAGPGDDAVTVVVAHAGVAFGVRVEGRDASRHADTLGAHAMRHLSAGDQG